MRDGRDFEELLEDARVREVLACALRDPDDESKPWATPLEIREMLSNIEVGALWLAYEDWQNDCGPVITRLSEPEYNALISQVAQAGDFDPLLLFAPALRRSFTRSMALELLSLRTHNALSSLSSTKSSSDLPESSPESRKASLSELSDAQLDKVVSAVLARIAASSATDDTDDTTED